MKNGIAVDGFTINGQTSGYVEKEFKLALTV
jgi:hypothetical protein